MNENTNLIDINENPIDLFDRWFQQAKLMEIDDRGRLNFSMKALMERPPRDSKPESSHS